MGSFFKGQLKEIKHLKRKLADVKERNRPRSRERNRPRSRERYSVG